MLTANSLTAIVNLGSGPAPDNNCALCVNGPGTYNIRPFTLHRYLKLGRKACFGEKESLYTPRDGLMTQSFGPKEDTLTLMFSFSTAPAGECGIESSSTVAIFARAF